MPTIRYRVRYPWRPDLPPPWRWGSSVIEIETEEDGAWIRIRRVGGEAPPAGLLPALMLQLQLVQVESTDVGGTTMEYWVATPERLLGISIGYTGREGSTGAMWQHCWELDTHGYRARPLAYMHESMYGKMNEPVWGYAAILFKMSANNPSAGDYLQALSRGHVQIREDRPLGVAEVLGSEIHAWIHGALEPSPEPVAARSDLEPPPPPPPCEGE